MLQWLLLLIGIAIVVSVYAYTRYQQRDTQARKPSHSQTPHISHAGDGWLAKKIGLQKQVPEQASGKDFELDGSTTGDSTEDVKQDIKQEETIFSVNILAPKPTEWTGDQIMRCVLATKLRCGDNGVFEYCPTQDDSSRPLFCLANYIEPGTFDWDKMSLFRTRGLIFIMLLPLEDSEHSAKEALDLMLACAQQVSEVLSGTICDSKREPLSREQVKDMHAICKQYDTQT